MLDEKTDSIDDYWETKSPLQKLIISFFSGGNCLFSIPLSIIIIFAPFLILYYGLNTSLGGAVIVQTIFFIPIILLTIYLINRNRKKKKKEDEEDIFLQRWLEKDPSNWKKYEKDGKESEDFKRWCSYHKYRSGMEHKDKSKKEN